MTSCLLLCLLLGSDVEDSNLSNTNPKRIQSFAKERDHSSTGTVSSKILNRSSRKIKKGYPTQPSKCSNIFQNTVVSESPPQKPTRPQHHNIQNQEIRTKTKQNQPTKQKPIFLVQHHKNNENHYQETKTRQNHPKKTKSQETSFTFLFATATAPNAAARATSRLRPFAFDRRSGGRGSGGRSGQWEEAAPGGAAMAAMDERRMVKCFLLDDLVVFVVCDGFVFFE